MAKLRVLSIDWDFLFNASLEQRMLKFPDCCNEKYPSYLQDIIWSSRYAESKEIEDIAVDARAMSILKEYISNNCTKDTFCTVWDSHKNLYDEIISRVKGKGSLEVVNVDFHHDMYDSQTSEIDCGNWVTFLYEEKERNKHERYHAIHPNDRYYWVAREDSDVSAEYKEYLTMISIDELPDIGQFDLLFICRSSMWSPPHLDIAFDEFCKWVNDNVTRTEINITQSRYTASFKKAVDSHCKQIDEIRNKAVK